MLSQGHPLLSAGVVARDFLDPAECAETVRRVVTLRDRWTVRSNSGIFTLGATTYIDGASSQDCYLAAASQTNSILSDAFGDLYDAVQAFLECVLAEPVSYDARLALPGFHIFLFEHEADNRVAQRAHFDLQFRQAVPGLKPEATLSFTLPLEQPSGGAGMAVWPFRYEEAVRLSLSGSTFAAEHPCEHVSYQPGRMVLHDGLLLHAIGATYAASPTGRRITLQGHGIRSAGRWTIYW
jgi:hypothetical protein